MKNSLHFLLFAVLLFTSCNDDEVPQSVLSGTYELVRKNTDTNIWYAGQYQFKSDGTYEYFSLARESQNGADLGYSYYLKGTYTLRGEEFVTKVTEILLLKDEDWPTRYTESLEELEVQEMPEEAPESKGTLKRLDGGTKISILFQCNDTFSSSNCIGALEYTKVD